MVFAARNVGHRAAGRVRRAEPDFPLKERNYFMGLDIRWPIGLMFSLIGAMLVIFGLVTGSSPETYKPSLGININLYWGVLLLVFGGWMLTMAIRASRAAPPAAESASEKPGTAGRR